MLKINYITLENFGPITQKKKVVFDNGFNVIWAKNGSGKTKAFTALEMLLIDNYKGSFEDYINWNSDFFNIELNFEFNDDPYYVTLKCSKNKNTVSTERKLYKGSTNEGNPIASGDEAKEYLSKLLDKNVVQYALMVKQSTEDHIVDCKDAERRDLIQKIKGIDYSEKVELEIEPKIRVLTEEIEKLEKEIYSLEVKTYQEKTLLEIPCDENKINELHTRVSVLEAQLSSYLQSLNLYTQQEKNKVEIENRVESLQNTILNKKQTLVKLEEELVSLNDGGFVKNKNETDAKTKAEKEAFTSKIEEFNSRKETASQQFLASKKELEEKIESLLSKVGVIQVSKLLKFDDSQLNTLIKEKATLEANHVRALKDKQNLEQGICPTCHQDCSHVVQDIDLEISSLLLLIEKVKEEIKLIEAKKVEHETKIENNNKLKEERERLSNEKLDLESKLNTLVVTYEGKVKEGEVWLEAKTEAHNLALANILKEFENKNIQIEKDIQSTKSQVEEVKKDISSFEADLITTNNKKVELEAWFNSNPKPESEVNKDEIDLLNKQIKEYDSVVIQNIQIEKFNKELKDQKVEDESKLQTLLKNKQEKLNSRLNYETAKNILLKEFPSFIIDSSVEEIEEAMNQFITNIYYKDLGISLRPTKTSLKLEYGLGKNKKPAHLLSGAERKITDIAFKNNYNNLAELSCILLDEPDAALDSTNKLALFEALTEMVDVYNQVIVVSHNKEMVEFLKNNSLECNIIQF